MAASTERQQSVKLSLKEAVSAKDPKELKSPKGAWSYVEGIFNVIGKTVGFFIIVALSGIFQIAMIAVGAAYLESCPIERYIPIYMIVAGVFGLLKIANKLYNRRRINKLIESTGNPAATLSQGDPLVALDSLLTTFLFIWNICGSVWVFRASPTFREPLNVTYCHRGLYLFAYIWLIVFWISILLTIALCCCCCGCILCGVSLAALAGIDENKPVPTDDPENPSKDIDPKGRKVIDPDPLDVDGKRLKDNNPDPPVELHHVTPDTK